MKAINFLDNFTRLEKPVFNIEDAIRVLNKPRPYTRVYLHRLEKQGLIKRIERGKYALRGISPFIIASNIVFPSYVSLWMAFYLHHLTTQLPLLIQVITPKQKKHLKFDDYNIKFIKLAPNRVFGYKKERTALGYMFIAEKEKAILDSLYLGEGPDLDDIRNALHGCDIKKLEEYALRMRSNALIKRVGYLMEHEHLEIPESFRNIDSKPILLQPNMPKRGKKDKNWKVIVNYRFDEYDN
jgi:predicted transcriptional regulator of viral defense system